MRAGRGKSQGFAKQRVGERDIPSKTGIAWTLFWWRRNFALLRFLDIFPCQYSTTILWEAWMQVTQNGSNNADAERRLQQRQDSSSCSKERSRHSGSIHVFSRTMEVLLHPFQRQRLF